MMLTYLRYPATLLLPLIALYVVVAGPPGMRLQLFTVAALTAVGSVELAMAAWQATLARRLGRDEVARTVTGVGALTMGFAALDVFSPMLFIGGTLAFAVGVLLRPRPWRSVRT